MPILGEVGEVHAQRSDEGDFRLRETLPSFHCFHIGRESDKLLYDKLKRVNSEDAEYQIRESDHCADDAGEENTVSYAGRDIERNILR